MSKYRRLETGEIKQAGDKYCPHYKNIQSDADIDALDTTIDIGKMYVDVNCSYYRRIEYNTNININKRPTIIKRLKKEVESMNIRYRRLEDGEVLNSGDKCVSYSAFISDEQLDNAKNTYRVNGLARSSNTGYCYYRLVPNPIIVSHSKSISKRLNQRWKKC